MATIGDVGERLVKSMELGRREVMESGSRDARESGNRDNPLVSLKDVAIFITRICVA